jgi:hypothetical protein
MEDAMCAMVATERSPDSGRTSPPTISSSRELWRAHGATDDLRALAITTSFGYAFGLELDHELILLHLQPSLEVLVSYAHRIEAALLAQGWRRIDPAHAHTKERS